MRIEAGGPVNTLCKLEFRHFRCQRRLLRSWVFKSTVIVKVVSSLTMTVHMSTSHSFLLKAEFTIWKDTQLAMLCYLR